METWVQLTEPNPTGLKFVGGTNDVDNDIQQLEILINRIINWVYMIVDSGVNEWWWNLLCSTSPIWKLKNPGMI